MKPNFDVHDAHFSGKQCTLHCVVVVPGEQKCENASTQYKNKNAFYFFLQSLVD